jgi:hypothetical protein
MKPLIDYVIQHVQRGACTCGECIDAPVNAKEDQPTGHTVDLIFFKVALKDDEQEGKPNKEEFLELVKQHKGEYGDVFVLDGKEHSYMELGGWIGDQGLAMMFMGLGTLLDVFTLLTPAMLPGISEDLQLKMAQAGYLSIIAKK